MTESIADHDLVRQALAGQSTAFDTLTDRHRPALVRFNALMIGDADEAESLAQEALTRAYTQLAEFDLAQSFPGWLKGIALNLCRNLLRSRSRHAKLANQFQLEEAPAREGQRQGALSGILKSELHGKLWIAIELLPLPFREAVILHYIEGLDYADMSRITGVSANALRARALRARTLLRDNLGAVVDTWMRQG